MKGSTCLKGVVTLGYLGCKIPGRLPIKLQLALDKICFIKALTNVGIYLGISVEKRRIPEQAGVVGNITETFMTSALTILFDRWDGPGGSRGRVGLFCIVDGTSHPACI